MKRLINAVGFPLMGLQAAWKSEPAFRQEVVLFFVFAPMALWLGDTAIDQAILIGALFIVLIIELLNSGLETAIDRISDAHHPLSKKAKDIGSAAVFLSLMNAAVVWVIILV